jgi:hypothetical protein
MSVNGMTAPSRSPPTSHQNVAPASHAATEGKETHGCQGRLHHSGSTIAGREFVRSYIDSAFHSGWMFDKIDVDGGSREQAARQDCNKFGNLAHRFFLPTKLSQMKIKFANCAPEP